MFSFLAYERFRDFRRDHPEFDAQCHIQELATARAALHGYEFSWLNMPRLFILIEAFQQSGEIS